MFGGYLELIRMAEDVARRMNKILTAYRKLECLDKTHTLLSLIEITEDSTVPSPYPEICPVNFGYMVTKGFIERYKDFEYAPTTNVMIHWAEGLEQYVAELEEETRRIQQDTEK